MIDKIGFMCEREKDCKWKCFALDKNGFSFGKATDQTPAWREAHENHCGGWLIPVRIHEIGDSL